MEKKEDFLRYRNMLIESSREKRKGNPEFSTSLPKELRIQLTLNCNLKCRHCFQWNNEGYYHNGKFDYNSSELPFDVLVRLLSQTRKADSIIYFWGGEPLTYSHWELLPKLLINDNRTKVISTNGTLIENKINSLNEISKNLDIIISLDGLEEEHDYLRGNGTFVKVIKGLNILSDQKKEGDFKGQISINCSIHNNLIPNLFHFVEFCSTLNIYKLILGFPWFINEQTKNQMDEYYKENFKDFNKNQVNSWYSFNYHIDPKLHDILKEQIDQIKKQHYNFILRFQPDIKNDLLSIISGNAFQNKKTSKCIATAFRLAVWSNGDVSFCGDFSEFCVGNLINNDLEFLWKSKEFNQIRRIINTNPKPSSLCQRCRFSEDNLV